MLKASLSVFWAVLRRDLTLAFRHRAEVANPLLFFVLIVSLYPLGIGPEPQILKIIAPGAIWVAALLAALLSLESLFRSDFQDGSLEQFLLSPYPLPLLLSAKVLAHWLVSGLPLLLAAPLLGVWLNLPPSGVQALITTLALGTPLLSLLGAIGTALTLGLKRSGILLTLLVLPWYIPVLIFATGAVGAACAGLSISGQLYLLAALLVLALTLTPLALAAAVRISLS